ncbi:unnamed protein product, partial [marine sediment metagenome]
DRIIDRDGNTLTYAELFDYEWVPVDGKVTITCEGKTVKISRESAKALNLI